MLHTACIKVAVQHTTSCLPSASPPTLMFDPVTFTLNCTSTGVPPGTVTWMKNGSSLSGDYNITSQVPKVGSTTIYDSVLALPHSGDAAGNYTCEIENALFKFSRLSITLQGTFVTLGIFWSLSIYSCTEFC